MTRDYAQWTARASFFVVFVWNVLCALQFIATPDQFAASYQLEGVPGEVAVRGLGVVFLMWNATYPLFILRPRRYPALGVIIAVQQFIGLLGETAILAGLPAGYGMLGGSIVRFIIFDAVGLALMLAALFGLMRARRRAL